MSVGGTQGHTGLLNFLGWLLGENMCAFCLFEGLVNVGWHRNCPQDKGKSAHMVNHTTLVKPKVQA